MRLILSVEGGEERISTRATDIVGYHGEVSLQVDHGCANGSN